MLSGLLPALPGIWLDWANHLGYIGILEVMENRRSFLVQSVAALFVIEGEHSTLMFIYHISSVAESGRCERRRDITAG